MADEPIEGTAVDVDEEKFDGDEAVEASTDQGTTTVINTGLVAAPARDGVIAPLSPEVVVEAMEQYQALLPRLLSPSDYQDAGGGKKFVKKSGWRKIAKAFGLSTEIVSQSIERNADGEPLRATVIVRAMHGPTGQHSDGDGHCSISETRFSGPRGNMSKVENDLTATATTRAKNRAISDLVGMGDVSAEEMEAARQGPPFGPEAQDKAAASAALIALIGDKDIAEALWGQIKAGCGGYIPDVVAGVLVLVQNAREEGD